MQNLDLYKDGLLGDDAEFEHEEIADGLEFEGEESLWGGFTENVINRPSKAEKEIIDYCDAVYEDVILSGEEVECTWVAEMFGEVKEDDNTFDAYEDSIARLDREIWAQIENENWED